MSSNYLNTSVVEPSCVASAREMYIVLVPEEHSYA